MIRTLPCLAASLCCILAPGVQGQLVRQANTTLAMPADLPASSGFTLARAFELQFSQPLALVTPPGETNRLFVVEKGGRIQVIPNLNAPVKELFFDLAARIGPDFNADGESGLLGLAFHPRYAENDYFYVFYSLLISGTRHQRVARFSVSATDFNRADPDTHLPLITQLDEASNHNGGDMHFGPDGYLYISLGDEGNANDSFANAHRIDRDFFAAILRIDVDRKPGNLEPNNHVSINKGTGTTARYSIPSDNPFIGAVRHRNVAVNTAALRTEIWATGLRNPWRMSFDRPTGRLFVADVGQGAWEEVNIVTKGADAGWKLREGRHAFSGTVPAGVSLLEPIHEYDHSVGQSITGGVVYRGSRFTDLYESYICADYASRRIFALKQTGSVWTGTTLTTPASGGVAGIGHDPRNGEVLFADLNEGRIKRLERSGTTGTAPPAKLSQTGAFSDLATLTPHGGIVPYSVNVPFWSDNAEKTRWFSVPQVASKIGFAPEANWTFPAGAVWVKHFDLEVRPGEPKRRLETRFIVKNAAGAYGVTYRWNAAGTDADLVPEEGASETIAVGSPGAEVSQVWRYPSRSECRTCHTPNAGFALGFSSRQLNRNHRHGTADQNQLTALSGAGYFTGSVGNVRGMPAFSRATDETQSLETRVRSYLAVNCVQCHQPGGAALGLWDARATTPTDAAGLIRGALVDSGGDSANRFVVPGDSAHSMVLKRLQRNGMPAMPPLGSSVIDSSAVQLVTRWINEALPQRQSLAEWQTVHFGSPTAAGSAETADPDGDGRQNGFEFLTGTPPREPDTAWALKLEETTGAIRLTFPQPANRSFLVETSTDLFTWNPWDVPGNEVGYPAAGTTRELQGSAGEVRRYFRLRMTAP